MEKPRKDSWAILLDKLAGINAPPKARQAFQQYMHESYATKIGPVVEARWKATFVEDDDHTTKHPNAPFRAKVARELFDALSKDEQDGLRRRAKEDAQEGRNAYINGMKHPSTAPEDRQRCIDQLKPFMSALMRGVSEYTGLHAVMVFGGPIPERGGEIATVHAAHGKNRDPSPCTFPEWDRERFDHDVLDLMMEYLQTAFTPEECAQAALPDILKKLSLDDEEEDSEEIDPELAIAMEKKRERKREEKRERKREEKKERKRVKKAMKEAAAAAGEPTKKRKLTDRESENAGSSKRVRGTKTAPLPPRLNISENDDVPERERENGIARNTAATAEVEYVGNRERVALQKAQTQGAPRLSTPETDAESTDSEIGGAGLSKSVVWDDEVPPIACLSP